MNFELSLYSWIAISSESVGKFILTNEMVSFHNLGDLCRATLDEVEQFTHFHFMRVYGI